MKHKRIIITSISVLIIAIITIAIVGYMLLPPGLKLWLNNDPSSAVIEFYEDTDRVPKDIKELIDFCATEHIEFDATPYKEMSFRSDAKRIYINYTTHEGSEGSIEFLKELFNPMEVEHSPSEYDEYENLREKMKILISNYYQENKSPPKTLIDLQDSALEAGITQLKSFSMKKKLFGGYKIECEIRSDETPPQYQLFVSFHMTKDELKK